MEDQTQAGKNFGLMAEQYDAARPGYPPEFFDALSDYSDLGGDARALDIGAGTGQATRQLAAAGMTVVALEPDAAMVSVLERRLTDEIDAGAVTTLNSTFESADLPAGTFDLVFSATAWHWLAEGRRWELALRALRPGGTVAVMWHWPLWRHTDLRAELDAIYASSGADLSKLGVMVEYEPTLAALQRDWLADAPPDRVARPRGIEHDWRAPLSAGEYVALTRTYGDHIALEPAVREEIGRATAAAIDAAGGQIELPYKTMLFMATRV